MMMIIIINITTKTKIIHDDQDSRQEQHRCGRRQRHCSWTANRDRVRMDGDQDDHANVNEEGVEKENEKVGITSYHTNISLDL